MTPAMWTIKGEVTNNSGSDLTSATVVAGLFDARIRWLP